MYEKKEYNNHIEYNKKNNIKLKIISDLVITDPEIRNKSISKSYSIEETLDSKNLNVNGIDINTLKSIRLSQTFENKELNSEILLDGMAGIKSSNQNTKPDSFNNKNDDKINIFKSLYKESTENNKNINTEKNYNYKEEEIIYIKEYENNDNNESENYYRNNKENEKMNYEDFVKYRKNNKLLKQQNELFIELLDNNKDYNKYNKRNRNIIISNLNEALNYYTVNQDVNTELGNNKDNINTKKFKNFKNYVKIFSNNKKSMRKKISKKYSMNEKIYEYSNNNNKRNNNKKFNKFVNNNSNEMNKTNNNSLKMKNFKMKNDLFYYNNKFIKYLNNNKESKKKFIKNENSYKYNNKNNIEKKASVNIINIGPNLINVKSNLKRNKSVKSVFNKILSINSIKDYKIIKKLVKKVDSTYNHKQKEKKNIEDEKSFNNKNTKIKYIPIEFKKYCFNRNLERNVFDNNNITFRNIKKNNINNINIEKSNDWHKNTLNNVSIKKSNSSYNSFKNKNIQNSKINYNKKNLK